MQARGAPARIESVKGYERVLELLRQHHIPEDIRAHQPVMTMKVVISVLDAPVAQMVKSVLLAADATDHGAPEHPSSPLFLFGLPADRKISLGAAAKLLGKSRERLRLAIQIEVETLTGFKVGSIPPFGMPSNIPVIMDSRLQSFPSVWCGTGKSTESLRVSIENLKLLSNCSFADVSKAENG